MKKEEKKYHDLRCLILDDEMKAYGHAINLLRRVEPFKNYQFGGLSSVVLGQILRKHYVLTLSEREAVGYVGWALCSEEIARAWMEHDYVPTFEECDGGDVFVAATIHAKSSQVMFYQARQVRKLYPGGKLYGRRDYNGRIKPLTLRNMTADAE